MKINRQGWLKNTEIIHSANFSPRPDSGEIHLIVVHGISLPPGQYGGDYIRLFFSNKLDPAEYSYFAKIESLKVSAHCLIDRDGNLVQFVSFLDQAWHAGASCWQGEENCNDYSIGIELEGTDDEEYEDSQYQQLARLVITLRKQYPAISRQSICGHSDISPGRKTDPGPFFDWQKLFQLIDAEA